MAQIMGSVNNVQLLPGKNGAEPLASVSIETVSLLCRIPEGAEIRVLGEGKNGYKPVEIEGLPRSGQMVVADFRATMKKGKRPARWVAGWRPMLEWADDVPFPKAHKIRPVFPLHLQSVPAVRNDKPMGHPLSKATQELACKVARSFFTWAQRA